MNPLELRVLELEEQVAKFDKVANFILYKNTQILDGRNIQTGRTTGTKIGTATDQLLGFYGTTPVNQPATLADIASAGGDNDGTARTRCDAIVSRLQELGLIA